MNAAYKELAVRIRDEVPELERLMARAMRNWQHVVTGIVDQDVYLDSVALNVYSFYSGLERLLELIARHVDRNAPTGDTWHQDLLRQMKQDVPGARPSVISHKSYEGLDEFRRFRHLVRNVYATNLRPDRLQDLLDMLPTLWPALRAELLGFADYLDQLNSAMDDAES
ncbi:MAG: antitoxin [Ardenticatenaceae bacterium]